MVLMNLFAGQEQKLKENRLMDTAGEGEGETNWKSNIETYTLLCVK